MNYVTRFRRAINNFLQYPAYPAYSLRPDTFFSAKVYFFLGFLFHPIEFLKRKISVSRLPLTEIKIDRDKGYIVLEKKDFPEIGPMVNYAQDLFAREKEKILGGEHRKKFLIQRWLGAEENHELIWKFAVNKKLLAVMSNYLGYVPLLGSAALMYSPNVDMEAGRSQMYHMDGEDIRQLKIFIYLNDVDESTGPLTFLPAKPSRKLFETLFRNSKVYRRNEKVTDEEVFKIVDKKNEVVIKGETGTVVIVDTDSCYHFGSRPGGKPRLILQLQYLGPFSNHQPIVGRKVDEQIANMYRHDSDFSLKKLVLGYQHLAFPKLKQ